MSFIRTIIDKNFLNTVVVEKISTGDTASLSDQNSIVEFQNSTSDYIYTIPPDSTTAFPKGSWIICRKTGTGDITIARGSSVVFRSVLGDADVKIDGEDGFSVYLEKTAVNTWLNQGNIKSAV